MATIVKELVRAKLAESAQTTQYTAVRCTAVIDKFTATNETASNVTLSVHLVPSGGTPGPANRLLNERQLGPRQSYPLPEVVGHALEDGSFISTLASTAAAITIRVSGREITS